MIYDGGHVTRREQENNDTMAYPAPHGTNERTASIGLPEVKSTIPMKSVGVVLISLI